MRLRYLTIATIALITLPAFAYAAPGIPAQFYGSVSYASGVTPSGLPVVAHVGSTAIASSTTDSNGNYGLAPNLLIVPDSNDTLAGTTITFTVNGVAATQTAVFTNAALTQLNLTVSGSAPSTQTQCGGGSSSSGGGGAWVAVGNDVFKIGTTDNFAATVMTSLSNYSNPAVTYSSSNPTVASVDSSGLVAANAAGTATITATVANSMCPYSSGAVIDHVTVLASNQVALAPSTTLDTSTPSVVVSPTDTSASAITVPSTVTNPALDLSTDLSGDTATVPANIIVNTNTAMDNFSVSIPSGTTITPIAGGSWNGVLNLPETTTTYTAPTPSGYNVSVSSAIEIGLGNTPLTLSNPVELTFPGQAGQSVGWSQGGAFTPITTVCNSITSPTNFSANGDCMVTSGSNLIVWTKHFTTFITYTQTAIPAPVVSSSGGGGGGGGSSSGGGSISTSVPAITPTVPPTLAVTSTVVSTTTPVQQGQVLGASSHNFTKNLTVGSQGSDVTALQQFLISSGYSIPAGATGHFGAETKTAVIAYQKANALPMTGLVGPLTRALLNKGEVPTTSSTSSSSTSAPISSGLTATQVSSIVAVLQSFNVDSATLAKVEAALGQ